MKCLICLLFVVTFFSCKKNEENTKPHPQTLVTNNTSGVTGNLTVFVQTLFRIKLEI